MQKVYTVIVETDDGKCLIREKITGNLRALSSLLAQLSSHYGSLSEGIQRSETLPGSGISPSASDFS